MTKQDSEKNKIYSNKKQEIVKPSKSMMVDTTTGMVANIFLIPKKKPKKKKSD